MEILQVITRTVAGGAQTVVAHLSNELVKRGHHVTVVSGEGDGTLWGWLDSGVKQVFCPDLGREISLSKDIKASKNLREIYTKIRPDIIHLHTSKAGTLGRLVFPKHKTIYTVHGFDGVNFRLYKQVEWLMQFRCSALIGVCQNDVKDMTNAHITKNVSYVFNGIPYDTNDDSIEWSIPTKYKKIVLCIARVCPPKNTDLFLQTALLLPQYAFVWIGNTSPVEEHPENVFFLGNFPHASRYCKLCDIFMLPSNYEGLPMTIIEAMSYGKPIVASNVGGVSEIVRNGINGFSLNNEATIFADSIKEILENNDVYNKMSENSKKIFFNELSAEKMTEKYLKVYETLIKNKVRNILSVGR